MSETAEAFKADLQKYARPEAGAFAQRFFRTGKGQYGEGDVFIGVKVPALRAVCRQYKDLPLPEIKKLLASGIHEHRLAAVILLANQYAKADDVSKKAIYDLYLQAVYDGQVNNWDIVDSSAPYIVGKYLLDKPRAVLLTMAKSDDLWQRRVAMLSTYGFIREGDPSTSLVIAEQLLHDKQDLIQKAVGWMLREVGKRIDRAILLGFLDEHAHEMPRTMLRYSIEHLPPEKRAQYMTGKESRN